MHRDRVPVPTPCEADWKAMSGDERRRLCSLCDRHVHDLNAHTEPEAEALLANATEICVQYRTLPSGHLPFRRLAGAAMFAASLTGTAAASAPVAPTGWVERLSNWILDLRPPWKKAASTQELPDATLKVDLLDAALLEASTTRGVVWMVEPATTPEVEPVR